MDASHLQNSMRKIVKIWSKTSLTCVTKYPIPIFVVFLFFLSYMFFPRVYTFLIYSSPLVGFSFLVHKILLGVDRQEIKRVEEDDRRKKFAKSRRSFKSVYGDRRHVIRRNAKEKNGDIDAIFSKSLNDLLFEERPKETRELSFESIISRGECSFSNSSQSLKPEKAEIYNRLNERYKKYGNENGTDKDTLEGGSSDISENEEDEPHDKAVQWTEDDQKNVMDLRLLETERNKRLEGLIKRRRSRKNLDFDDRGAMGNNCKAQISAIKITKTNPFLDDDSHGRNTPGSAPSLLETRNPFDLPYDPHEEKPDLSGDDFHEEFKIVHHKEPIYCRHESFHLGAFSYPEITHDRHERSFYKGLPPKSKKTLAGLRTSIVDDSINDKEDEESSSERVVGNLHEEDEPERKEEEINGSNDLEQSDVQRNGNPHECGPSTMYNDQKVDICFVYGGAGHGPSNSTVSDLQVEVSDGESYLENLDVEKKKEAA